MVDIPPIPSWSTVHPMIVHFPIVLLLIAPVLILIGAILGKEKGRVLLYTALGMVAFGTLAAFFAVATGDAASEVVAKTSKVAAVLSRHEELAEITRGIFSFLTIILAAVVFAPIVFPKLSGRLVGSVLPVIFLLLYGVGVVFLVNTAHFGARLVHEYGVRANLSSGSTMTAITTVNNQVDNGNVQDPE